MRIFFFPLCGNTYKANNKTNAYVYKFTLCLYNRCLLSVIISYAFNQLELTHYLSLKNLSIGCNVLEIVQSLI